MRLTADALLAFNGFEVLPYALTVGVRDSCVGRMKLSRFSV